VAKGFDWWRGVRNNFGAIIPCDNYNKEVNKEVTFVD
jgi:hypothetical protein